LWHQAEKNGRVEGRTERKKNNESIKGCQIGVKEGMKGWMKEGMKGEMEERGEGSWQNSSHSKMILAEWP
jgi:hypothetical protein